jgi:hypothetical protein
MPALDPAIGNALNDALLNNGSSGTVAVGAVTLTLPMVMKYIATRGSAGVAGTAISGTNTVSLSGKFGTASTSISNVPTKSNDSAISITASASGTWNGIEVQDSTGTPKRTLYGPSSDLAKAFASGDILSVPASNLTLTTQ